MSPSSLCSNAMPISLAVGQGKLEERPTERDAEDSDTTEGSLQLHPEMDDMSRTSTDSCIDSPIISAADAYDRSSKSLSRDSMIADPTAKREADAPHVSTRERLRARGGEILFGLQEQPTLGPIVYGLPEQPTPNLLFVAPPPQQPIGLQPMSADVPMKVIAPWCGQNRPQGIAMDPSVPAKKRPIFDDIVVAGVSLEHSVKTVLPAPSFPAPSFPAPSLEHSVKTVLPAPSLPAPNNAAPCISLSAKLFQPR